MIDFDERAQDWDSDPMKVKRARVVAQAIRDTVPLTSHTRALEYGCGTGLLSFALQPFLASITLMDTSQGMLDVLQSKINPSGAINMVSLRLDLLHDPLPAQRFHIIYSLMTLHHIPATNEILRNFFTILEPGGTLCIADLEKEDGSFHGPGFDGHSGFERTLLQQEVESTGFINVRFSSVFTLKKPVNGVEKIFPVFLMTAHKE